MLLFFLPILGAPISAIGLIVGSISGVLACCGKRVSCSAPGLACQLIAIGDKHVGPEGYQETWP